MRPASNGTPSKAISLEDVLELYKLALEETALLVITNTEGKITYASKEFCSISGFTPEEFYNMGRIFLNGNQADNNSPALWETINSGKEWRGNLGFFKKNGQPFKLNTTIFPFPSTPATPIQFLSVCHELKLNDQTHNGQQINSEAEPLPENYGHKVLTNIEKLKELTSLIAGSPLGNNQKKIIQDIQSCLVDLDEIGFQILKGQYQENGNKKNQDNIATRENNPVVELPTASNNFSDPINVPAINSPSEVVRILIAEDIEFNQLVMQKHLEKLKFSFEFANDGMSVLEKLDQTSYDIILMDMQMPVMDGSETIKQIRSSASDFRNIPIIAITASIKGDAMARCLEAGADDYLPKPFEISELNSKIFKLVSEKRKNIHMENQSEMPSPQGQQPLINLEYLEQLSDGDKEFTVSMIQYFIDNTPEVLESMKQSYQQKDWKALRNIAHKFKPQLNFMGINTLLDDVEQMEQLAHQEKNLDSLPVFIEKTERVCIDAIKQLQAKLEETTE